MEIETLEYNTLQYDNQKLDASLININLSDIIKNLKVGLSFSKKNIITVALLNEPGKKIIITAVHENSDIQFNKSANSLKIQVLEGVLVFRTQNESVTLCPGMMLSVREEISFWIRSVEKSLFMVTLENKSGEANTGYN